MFYCSFISPMWKSPRKRFCVASFSTRKTPLAEYTITYMCVYKFVTCENMVELNRTMKFT